MMLHEGNITIKQVLTFRPRSNIVRNILPRLLVLLLLLTPLLSGCASVPPEVAQVHQEELKIIDNLKASHLAVVDAYVDQNISAIENYFFNTYGPAYFANWKASFKQVKGRHYDEQKDFPILYSDLVVEYQEAVEPVEVMRRELKKSINLEYINVMQAHNAVNDWMKSINSLREENRSAINKILAGIAPGLSLDEVDKEVQEALDKIKEKKNDL